MYPIFPRFGVIPGLIVYLLSIATAIGGSGATRPQTSSSDDLLNLISSINDEADPTHSDQTRATRELIRLGNDAVPAVLPLMLADDEDTRLRAQRVLQGVLLERFGFKFGTGWSGVNREKEFLSLWHDLGDMSWRASEIERVRAVKIWVKWIVEKRMEIVVRKLPATVPATIPIK